MSIKERDVTKPIQEENASQENRWEYVLANPGGSSIPAFLPAASALLALALHLIHFPYDCIKKCITEELQSFIIVFSRNTGILGI